MKQWCPLYVFLYSYDDKLILKYLTRAFCPQLLRNLWTRWRIDSSSIIAHPVYFDKDR